MRKVNTIDAEGNAGFIGRVDPRSARRQFNVSLGLAVIVSLATLASAMTLGLSPRSPASQAPRLTVHAPQLTQMHQALRAADLQPGG